MYDDAVPHRVWHVVVGQSRCRRQSVQERWRQWRTILNWMVRPATRCDNGRLRGRGIVFELDIGARAVVLVEFGVVETCVPWPRILHLLLLPNSPWGFASASNSDHLHWAAILARCPFEA